MVLRDKRRRDDAADARGAGAAEGGGGWKHYGVPVKRSLLWVVLRGSADAGNQSCPSPGSFFANVIRHQRAVRFCRVHVLSRLPPSCRPSALHVSLSASFCAYSRPEAASRTEFWQDFVAGREAGNAAVDMCSGYPGAEVLASMSHVEVSLERAIVALRQRFKVGNADQNTIQSCSFHGSLSAAPHQALYHEVAQVITSVILAGLVGASLSWHVIECFAWPALPFRFRTTLLANTGHAHHHAEKGANKCSNLQHDCNDSQ